MPKTLVEMAADIVAAQASHISMSSDEINDTLNKLFITLRDIKNEENRISNSFDVINKVKVNDNPKASIQKDKVVCLECGKEFKQISRSHLKIHNLTPKEYKKKHGFSLKQALSSKCLTAKRRKLAKEKQLGNKLAEYRMKRAAEKGQNLSV
ncbi:MucR family transcriptional regulator [bacterium]|nr:MucR family transcriptional regulator [bacterium]